MIAENSNANLLPEGGPENCLSYIPRLYKGTKLEPQEQQYAISIATG